MLLIEAGVVWCGVSRGEVCLEPAAEEGRSALVMRCFGCRLLSRCTGLLRGIENVHVVFVGSCFARGHLAVLVLCCLRAALQRSALRMICKARRVIWHEKNEIKIQF